MRRCSCVARSQRTLLFTALVILLLVILYHVQVRLELVRAQSPRGEELAYLPDGQFLRVASLGYDTLLADLLWLKAIQVMGEKGQEKADAEWLYQAFDVITTLDPKFDYVYQLGSVLLSMLADRPDLAVLLLSKGVRHNPDVWQLHFFLGFNQFYHLGNFTAAADAMSKAAALPGRPDYVPLLAARLYAHAEEPELALEFLDRMYQISKDEQIRGRLLVRMKEIMAERDLNLLNQVVQQFYDRYDRYPEELSDLVRNGLASDLPAEPFGGYYYLDPADHQVKSSHYTERLRVKLPE